MIFWLSFAIFLSEPKHYLVNSFYCSCKEPFNIRNHNSRHLIDRSAFHKLIYCKTLIRKPLFQSWDCNIKADSITKLEKICYSLCREIPLDSASFTVKIVSKISFIDITEINTKTKRIQFIINNDTLSTAQR